jgi:cytochrome P450
MIMAFRPFLISVRLMSHDPEVYKDPMTFNPSRFMGNKPEQDARDYCFGFGRR